ncbi:hypothetical protein ACEZDB_25535 [Streptacidiphilus sp. N1-3]|uniref:Uncharacterized protein n=1 Tax=Streptacidiphilus alkalitolerans TaxID=3342712 RepID=A0ABV6X6W8_9ACTN
MTAAVLTRADRAAQDLADLDDIALGARLLAATPTHEGRDPELLTRWATTATEFGAALDLVPCTARVVESDGGLEAGLLARYTSRPSAVELYTDTIAAAEDLIDRLGWRHWYPTGSVRAAAIAHEAVHERLHHSRAKADLKRSLGHVVLRLGEHRMYGHVVGADEIVAHAYARTSCGLGRSPLLLTAALAATTGSRPSPAQPPQASPPRRTARENLRPGREK